MSLTFGKFQTQLPPDTFGKGRQPTGKDGLAVLLIKASTTWSSGQTAPIEGWAPSAAAIPVKVHAQTVRRCLKDTCITNLTVHVRGDQVWVRKS